MEEATLKRIVQNIVAEYREIEREKFSKGDYETLADRWESVLLSQHYAVAKQEIDVLHCGPSFVGAVDGFTQAIKEAQSEEYLPLGEMIKAYGAQTKLEGRLD